jgi:hypothetical protein
MPQKTAAETTYSVHPAVAYARTIIDNLPATTGKPIEEWVRLVRKSGPAGVKARREWLRKEHRLGATSAGMIADVAEGNAGELTDPGVYLKRAGEYVEAMYGGPKAGLRPMHDALLRLGTALGKDVKVCPCKTIVPLYRQHVFAQIKPTTRARIDLGLALKGCTKTLPDRLVDTGGLQKGDRITHRIAITALEDIDAEVKKWLKVAYDLDA